MNSKEWAEKIAKNLPQDQLWKLEDFLPATERLWNERPFEDHNGAIVSDEMYKNFNDFVRNYGYDMVDMPPEFWGNDDVLHDMIHIIDTHNNFIQNS